MGKMHRAQILLEPEQHEALAKIARRQGTSISEIVRTAVSDWLVERQEDESVRRKLEILEIVREHRRDLLSRHDGKPLKIDLNEWLDRAREERGDELFYSAFTGAADDRG